MHNKSLAVLKQFIFERDWDKNSLFNFGECVCRALDDIWKEIGDVILEGEICVCFDK